MAALERHRFALTVLALGLLVRLVASALIPPGFDESYYGVYSLHLAWGYYDHPPAVALVAGAGHWLTGSFSPLSLRLGAVLLFLPTAWLVYLCALELFGERAARASLLLLHVTPYFPFGVGAFVIPDDPLSLAWVLFLFGLLRVAQREEPRWFLLSGLALGLALLSKYHGVLLLGGVGLCVVFLAEWRRWLRTPWPWLALALAAALFLPNVLWNAQHDWVSYRLQFGKGASGGLRFSATLLARAVGGQLGYLLPWTCVVLLWVLVRFTRRNEPATRWLLAFAWPPVLAFTAIGVTRPILPHWPMPGYLAAVILAGDLLARWRPRRLRVLLWTSAGTLALAVSVLVLQARTGLLPLEGGADPTLDGEGWPQLVEELDARGLLARRGTFLMAHKWYTAGQLAWADEGRHDVVLLPPGAAHGFAYWSELEELSGLDGIFVCNERFDADPAALYAGRFGAIERLADVVTRRAGRETHRFRVWRCTGFRGPEPAPSGG